MELLHRQAGADHQRKARRQAEEDLAAGLAEARTELKRARRGPNFGKVPSSREPAAGEAAGRGGSEGAAGERGAQQPGGGALQLSGGPRGSQQSGGGAPPGKHPLEDPGDELTPFTVTF